MSKEKYISEKDTSYAVTIPFKGKVIYIGSVAKKEKSAFKMAKNMRDVSLALLEAGFEKSEIKDRIKKLDFSNTREIKTFISSIYDDHHTTTVTSQDSFSGAPLEPTDTTSHELTACTDEPEVNDNISAKTLGNINTDALGKINSFIDYYNTVKKSLPSELIKEIDNVTSELLPLTDKINAINETIQSNLTVTELLFYKAECNIAEMENKALKVKLKKAGIEVN